MTNTHQVPVLIVGAGPTGLVLALWLTKLGIHVRIIDKTSEPGTTSRALAIAARTLELYQQVDLADAIVAGAAKVAAANFWVGGKRAAHLELGPIGEGRTPYPFVLMFPQDEHESLLVERLAALRVQVERRTELIKIEKGSHSISATIKLPDGTEEICNASYVAGCDGAHSIVRESLNIGFPGGTYESLFYVADIEGTGPPINGEINLELDQADFLAIFPLKRQGHIRLIGSVRDESAQEKKELGFADVGQRAIEHMQLKVGSVNWFSTYHVHHRVAAKFRDGRAFLLGDAAHIHSPVGGQGMNTGIGDAVNLSWKLAEVLNGNISESVLDTYEVERIAFARRLVATTDRVFTFVTRRGGIAKLVRTKIVPAIFPTLTSTGAVRRFFFRTLSQTGIKYRGSTLSEGSVGNIHGGDRLPWIKLSSGRDNFEALRSLSWQVHVYGEPHRDLTELCNSVNLELHTFPWSDSFARAGFTRDALYLVRPDGYVALADRAEDPRKVIDYFRRQGIRFR